MLYRLLPDDFRSGYTKDSTKSNILVYKNISKYSGNPKNISLLEHFAVGHLFALVALDEHYLKNYAQRI